MKKIYKKSVYRGLFVVALLLTSQLLLGKSLTFSEKYEWTYDVDPGATIELSNYDCDVVVESSNTNTVRFVIFVDAQAKEQADIDILKNYLDELSFSARKDLLRLETTFWDNRSSNSSFGKNVIKMKLKNGRQIKLTEFKVKASLQIPESCQFDLGSKYSKIEMSNINDLILNSYDDKIYGKNAMGEVNIKAKYSNLEFGNFGPTEIDIYDSDFTAEKTEDLKIISKYSEINVNQAGNVDLDGYDDNMTFKTTGDFELKTKYSDLNCEKSGNLILEIYDSNLEVGEIGNLNISESKYSSYKFNAAGVVKISSSYDDDFSFEKVTSFKANSSKYSEFTMTSLTNSFTILEGYDDNVKIYGTSASFTHFDVNSKYANIILNTSETAQLKIDWNTKHGKIEIDESEFKTRIMIKDNSEYQYVGIKGTESEDMPYVKVRGYDIKMNLDN
jgi:hypothetical protein